MTLGQGRARMLEQSVTPEMTTTDTAAPHMAGRAAIASTVGSILEWVDFTTYGALAATVFPKLFFASMSPQMGILAAFATFGVGFMARPLGGILFGVLGDRYGRKNILLYTLTLMGVASVLIGCLPTYQSIGMLAPLALVTLRFLQGVALGGEATGAQLLTMEHAPSHKRGLFGSLINLGNSASAAIANGTIFLLYAVFGQEDFELWGWRIPFLFSFVLVLLGIYIRRKVTETPAFLLMKEREEHEATVAPKASISGAFRSHPGTIIRLILIWLTPSACFHVINVFSLGYITGTLNLSGQTAFLCLTAANLMAMCFIVSGGVLSDRIGRRATMLIAGTLTIIAAASYFALLNTGNWTYIFIAIAFFVCAMQIQSGVQPAMFAEPFPTSTRYSGSAIAYTGANLIAAGPAPFISSWLQTMAGGQTWPITLYLVTLGVISWIAIYISPETRGADLTR
jgi:MFS family permease